jgi:hypothetical protein
LFMLQIIEHVFIIWVCLLCTKHGYKTKHFVSVIRLFR